MSIEQQQEAIREGLALTLYGEFRGTFDRDSMSRRNAFADADRVLKYLTEKGAVLKVDTDEHGNSYFPGDARSIVPLVAESAK